MQIPWWAELIIGLMAETALILLGSYVALGKKLFKERAPAVVASAVLGFIVAPIFVGISGIIGLPKIASAFLLLMWVVLLRELVKLEWPGSIGLGLACTVLAYALVNWLGFEAILMPWWQALV